VIANQKVGRDVSSMLPPSQFDDSPRVPTCSDESSTRLETAMVESCDFELQTPDEAAWLNQELKPLRA